MKTSCSQILYQYLNEQEEWTKKVELYVVAEDWNPETVGRELRLLEEQGKIEVGYYKGKYASGLAKYRIKTPLKKTIYKIPELNKEITVYA